MLFTIEEKKNLIEFLDRVTLKGHQERADMNAIVALIVNDTVGEVKNEAS